MVCATLLPDDRHSGRRMEKKATADPSLTTPEPTPKSVRSFGAPGTFGAPFAQDDSAGKTGFWPGGERCRVVGSSEVSANRDAAVPCRNLCYSVLMDCAMSAYSASSAIQNPQLRRINGGLSCALIAKATDQGLSFPP